MHGKSNMETYIPICKTDSQRAGASLVAQRLKHLPAMWETRVRPLGREDYLGEGNGNPLQYSCLENPMDGGAWAIVHGVSTSRTRLSDFNFTFSKLKQDICINLEGWDGEGEGKDVQKGGDICIPMADSC